MIASCKSNRLVCKKVKQRHRLKKLDVILLIVRLDLTVLDVLLNGINYGIKFVLFHLFVFFIYSYRLEV